MCGDDPKPPCQSSRPPSGDGCCADGGRCDDICIQIAASYECSLAPHRIDADRQCDGKTCSSDSKPEMATPSCRAESLGGDACARKCCSAVEKKRGPCRDFEKPWKDNGKPGVDADCRGKCSSVAKTPGPFERFAEPCKGRANLPVDAACLDECCDSVKGKERGGCGGAAETRKDDTNLGVDDCSGKCCASVEKSNQGGCQGPAAVSRTEVATAAANSGCQMACRGGSKSRQDSCEMRDKRVQTNDGKNICFKSSETQAESDGNESCCPPGRSCSLSKATEGDGLCQKSAESIETTPFRQACASHLRLAFERYSSFLETGRCICRGVLSQANVCCDKEMRAAAIGGDASSSVDFRSNSTVVTGQQTRPRNSSVKKTSAMLDASEIHPRCSVDDIKTAKPPSSAPKSVLGRQPDPERSAARETVRFNITGMTCTGCSNKALKTLNRLDGISRAEVVFVTSIGEVDLDPCVTSSEFVLGQLERETGFKCTRIIQDEQVLEIIMPPDIAKKLQDRLPDGITSITKVGRSYQVRFDPAMIGARSVLSSTISGELSPPQDNASLAEGKKRLQGMAWSTGLATVFTVPILVLAWSDISTPYATRSIVSLVLATLVQALAIPEFYVGAIRSLVFSRVLEMDMLVVISITAAYGYSVIAFALTHAGYKLEEGEFFETSSLLITLVLFGRLIAAVARAKAVSTVSLRSLQAETAWLVQTSGESLDIDARLLQFGDTIIIKPHSRVVTDGIILKGTSTIDESMLTGENLPRLKGPGDSVIAGTINGPSPITIRLTRLPGQNSISDIANLVEDAIAAKPRVQDLADKVASWFIPAVVGISAIVFIVWLVVALKVRGKNAGGAVGLAMTYGIAVLAISCPCALGLAVPMVLVITGGVAARAGVIIKQADATERSHRVTDVIFDKTGTLTTGVLEVITTQILTDTFTSKDINSLLCALLKDNDHPVSQAVESSLQKDPTSSIELDRVESIPGAGIQALWNGNTVRAGNPYWLGIEEHSRVAELISQGMTLLCVTVGPDVLAVYGLKSSIREEATGVIAKLHRRGITCHIFSGDGPQVVEVTARTVGISLENIVARQSPAGKQQHVKGLMDQGKSVLFCGDGTNDAVAIAQASVGVQIGSASDITRVTADVVLLGGLEGIPVLLDTSERAFNRIVFNFAWSAIYNLFAILLAAGAFVKFRIPPAYAGAGEIVSVLPVIFAALTLMYVTRF